MADAAMILAWLEKLEDLQIDIPTSSLESPSAALLEAYAILACAPQAVGRAIVMPVSDVRFRELIDAEADESAALALIGLDTGYMVSRGANGIYLASVVLPGMTDDVCAEGATFAFALISAYLAALIGSCRSAMPKSVSQGSLVAKAR